MTKSDHNDLLLDLLGALPPERQAQLRERLSREPELAAARRDLTARWQSLELPPVMPAPPGFAQRVRARAECEERANPFGFGAGLLPASAAATVLGLGLALGAWLGADLGRARPVISAPPATTARAPVVERALPPPEPAVPAAEIVAAAGGEFAEDDDLGFAGDTFADAYLALFAPEDVAQ